MTNFYKSAYASFALGLTMAACTPSKPPTDGATAAAPAPAPAQPDIVAPSSADAAPSAPTPNTPGSLVSTSPANPAPPSANTPASVAAKPAPAAVKLTAEELDTARAAFVRTCAICHGQDGKGGPTAGEITDRDVAAIKNKMTVGKIKPDDKMLPMGAMLSEAEMDALAKFVAAGMPQG